jgi:hypothetical protein
MRQLEKRQIILLGVLAALIVVFVVWKFVLSSDDTAQKSVDPVTTQTTVATGQVTEDPANPATATDPTVTDPAAPAPAPVPTDVPFNTFAYRDPFQRAG